jgi:hypothetical protein
MATPDGLERQHTLATAVARYDQLRARDALASTTAEVANESPDEQMLPPQAMPLRKEEALELLALGEVIARKASYGRQLGVRSARAAGASWAQIGDALGTSKQSAWEAHHQWINHQAEQHRRE